MYKKLGITLFVMFSLNSAWAVDPIVTDSTSRSETTSNSTTTVKSPPPTAVAPAITTINNDVCATAASGAVQTQILGISMGGTVRDMNCERIKLSKNLYDMGMKVAAVATLCQDDRVFQAMLDAGTPCPIEGKIGAAAKEAWIKKGRIEKDQVVQTEENKKEQPVRDSSAAPKEVQGEAAKPSSAESFPVNTPQLGVASPLCPAYSGSDPIVKARVGCLQ